MNNKIVSAWLVELYEREIADVKSTIANERLWANGADNADAAAMHERNAELREEYLAELTMLQNNAKVGVNYL